MERDSENGNDENISVDSGIQLALDPDLISLPLNSSTVTPATTIADATGDDKLDGQKTTANASENLVFPMGRRNNEQALFRNPYAIFKQMPMQEFIPLLLHQRGPGFKFADLSEKDLIEEIKKEQQTTAAEETALPELSAADQDDDSAMDVDSTSNLTRETDGSGKDEHSRDRFEEEEELMSQEQFLTARKEMVEHVNLALNESSLALEFLSLLLSSVRESAGTASMSPFLKKTVPVGSLNSDKLPLAHQTREEIVSSEILSRGWKLRSLNESRSLLKEKYSSLCKIIEREHQYWTKISKHTSNKDVLFKMRDRVNGMRLLGIKYGYEDSGSTYKHDRGIAVLRNNPELNILELVPSNTTETSEVNHNERFVRVRIFTKIASEDDYILTGESSVNKLFSSHDNFNGLEDIENQINKLKAFAFEQELMYQLKKESSRLISYGVTIESESKIVMELPNEKFEVELISRDDNSVVNHDQDAPKVNDRRATLMVTTLRLLLVVMFKKNLRQRLTSSTRPQSSKGFKDVLLLRPILGRLRHHNYKILLKKILRDYVLDIIEGSSINEFSSDNPKSGATKALDDNIAKLSKEINAFGCLLNTSSTSFRVDVPGKGTLLLVLESPNYCNAVVTIKFESSSNKVSFDTSFSEFKEIEEFLHFVVTEYMKDKESVKRE
ncbi:hypothetical protein HG536_0F00730 [Torulaspora globosa]|uniref:Mediator of RNA polymerase II transcription subunit 17 n=1 Tax=Torulaspora globosa TaxID=48254 RepID=A0A7G3ZJR2_9SACH|nr:uncharacterized protein HG536_0F00730 [Torulaspora globosa]QLL33748.1 hypothetical protein HG536_0F00730 [Torulaspora globosa]